MSQVFKVGDSDLFIRKIQRALNEKLGPIDGKTLPSGAYLTPDGNFGPKTRDALMAFQKKIGVPVTGVYDVMTSAALGPYINARFLNEADFVNAANVLLADINMVKAVTEVESGEAGFFQNGKSKILFERHVFRKQLLKQMQSSTVFANSVCKKLGIAVTVSGPNIDLIDMTMSQIYGDIYSDKPGGYVGGTAEYNRLDRAKVFDASCAYRSASWGLFQIMGYHYSTLGYGNVEEMIAEFGATENAQLRGFCSFIKSDTRLINAIRNKDFLNFALAYNGPAQKGYDVKIKEAYLKYSNKK